MIATHKDTLPDSIRAFSGILMLSAWGFAMVIASFLFLWMGYKLDEYAGHCTKLHVRFVLSGDLHLCHETLSGSKAKNEGVIAATTKT